MGRKPPTYTFRRPRKQHPPPPLEPYQDSGNFVAMENYSSEPPRDYAKYSFILLLVALLAYVICTCYIYKNGMPVKIKA